MKVPSETFPGAGLQRHVCDKCGKPIVIAWTGRDGEYCSNKCLKEAEIKESNMTEETGTATAVEEAPKKKAAKKGVAKTKGVAKGKGKAKPAAKAKKATRASGKDSMAAKIIVLLERKGGCTMKEMRKIAPNSAGSLLFSFRKAGMKIKVVKAEDGTRTYSA